MHHQKQPPISTFLATKRGPELQIDLFFESGLEAGYMITLDGVGVHCNLNVGVLIWRTEVCLSSKDIYYESSETTQSKV